MRLLGQGHDALEKGLNLAPEQARGWRTSLGLRRRRLVFLRNYRVHQPAQTRHRSRDRLNHSDGRSGYDGSPVSQQWRTGTSLATPSRNRFAVPRGTTSVISGPGSGVHRSTPHPAKSATYRKRMKEGTHGQTEPTAGRRRNMQAIRRRDTAPELALRSSLHTAGLRFRRDYAVMASSARVRPDIVFTKKRVAVFVDGCFWHSCPQHGSKPRVTTDYWIPKLERIQRRDLERTVSLEADGWTAVRVWEHTDVELAVSLVMLAVQERGKARDVSES